MYTFSPIPNIDTLNDHTGFAFACVVAVIACVMLATVNDDGYDVFSLFMVYFIFASIPLGFVCYISYNTGKIVISKNEKVEASLVQIYSADVRQQSGKSYVIVQKPFIQYKTPDGIVTFPVSTGIAYPERAILYKN